MNKPNEQTDTVTGEIVSMDNELTAGIIAAQYAEIQGAIVLAKKFPRNIDSVFTNAMQECSRASLAKIAEYEYPRGGKQIIGPSVYLLRTLGRLFGNLRWGISVIADSDEFLDIESWCWDLENNIKIVEQDRMRKLIQRKGKGWIIPDERDLRELKNRRGAIGVRNCIKGIIPQDLLEDAVAMCRRTAAKGIKSVKDERKMLLFKFSEMDIKVDMLERYLGIKSKDWMPENLVSLQNILNAVADDGANISSFFKDVQTRTENHQEISEDDIEKKIDGLESGNGDDRKGYEEPDEEPKEKPKSKAKGKSKARPKAEPKKEDGPPMADENALAIIRQLLDAKAGIPKKLREDADRVTADDAEAITEDEAAAIIERFSGLIFKRR